MPSSLNGTGVTFNDGSTQSTAANSYTGRKFQIFHTSGTFTVPAGVTSLVVTCYGGGGGGASGAEANSWANNGGTGGFIKALVSVTPGAAYTVTVGAGGNATRNSTGNAGGTSSFGALVSATGGSGGYAGNLPAGTITLGSASTTGTILSRNYPIRFTKVGIPLSYNPLPDNDGIPQPNITYGGNVGLTGPSYGDYNGFYTPGGAGGGGMSGGGGGGASCYAAPAGTSGYGLGQGGIAFGAGSNGSAAAGGLNSRNSTAGGNGGGALGGTGLGGGFALSGGSGGGGGGGVIVEW